MSSRYKHPLLRGGSAARITSVSSGLRRSANLPSRTTFTFLGWFRREASGSGTQDIIGVASATSSPSAAYQLNWNTSALRVDWYDRASFGNVAFSRTPAIGEPFFGALTATPSGSAVVLRGYCISHDGSDFQTVSTTTSTDLWTAGAFNIGNQGWSEAGLFSAWGVRLWDATLEVGEIWREWAAGGSPARRRNLNAWWPLEGNEHQFIRDYSGNVRPLTIGGTVRPTRFFLPREFVELDDVVGKAPAAGGATTVNVGTTAHSYTAQAPQVRAKVQPAQVIHTYTTQAPQIKAQVKPAQVSHSYTAVAPQVQARVQPAQATHAYVAETPQVRASVRPAQVTHTYTAQTPQAKASVQPNAVTHAYTGQVPSVLTGNAIAAPTVTHTYTAVAPQVRTKVQPAQVVHTYTSLAPQAKASVMPGAVSHTYTGVAATLLANLEIAVPAASHSYSLLAPTISGVQEAEQERSTGGYKSRMKWAAWDRRLPTEEEIRRERERLGILPARAQKIVRAAVRRATEGVDAEQAAILAAAYTQESQQAKLESSLKTQAEAANLKWRDQMASIASALILGELARRADEELLAQLMAAEEQERRDIGDLLQIWMQM